MDYRWRKVLLEDMQLGPYPLEKLPHKDSITTEVVGPGERRWQWARDENGETAVEPIGPNGVWPFHVPYGRSIFETVQHIASYPENPVREKPPLPEDPAVLTRHLKRFTYFLGADAVGVCKVPPEAIYHDTWQREPYERQWKYAIVFLVRKEHFTEMATHGNEWIDDPASFAVYQRGALIAITLADYIRNLGSPARASCCENYVTLMPRLIVNAGLGEFSRMGIVLNPFFGTCFKAACVLTDMELTPDKPIDFGLQDYCESCMICAEQCPSKAVTPHGKQEHNGYVSWVLRDERCRKYGQNHATKDVCQRCTVVCPFNRPHSMPGNFDDWGDDPQENLRKLYESVNAQRDYLRTHDFIKQTELENKWWLPIVEDMDGTYHEAQEYDYGPHYINLKNLESGKPLE